MKGPTTPGLFSRATGAQGSLVASHCSLNNHEETRWPWVFSWFFHHPISFHFTCLPLLPWLNLPPIPDQPHLEPHPPRVFCVLFSHPFPDSISETHHLQIQPCLPCVSPKLGRLSLTRKWDLKFTLLDLAFAILLCFYPPGR